MAPDPLIRAFIALELSDESRALIADLIERLRKGVNFTPASPKWIEPDGIHLTLKFLGKIAPEQVTRIHEAMKSVMSRTAPFAFSARGLGVFPAEHRPRVLWVGIKRGADEVTALARRLESALIPLGFDPEGRPFTPHLTLARLKSNRGAREMMDVVRSHNRVYCGETQAERLTLIQSELRPEGARYTVLKEATLG